jgi:hypothetical protein
MGLIQRIVFCTVFLLVGCDVEQSIEQDLHIPLVVEIRLDAPNTPVMSIDKYFVQALMPRLNKIPHISHIHPIAYANYATFTLFFEAGPLFANVVQEIQRALPNYKELVSKHNLRVTQIMDSEMSLSNYIHLANIPGLSSIESKLKNKFKNAFQPIISVRPELSKDMMHPEDFDALFTDECDEVPDITSPLYVLDSEDDPIRTMTLEDLDARKKRCAIKKKRVCCKGPCEDEPKPKACKKPKCIPCSSPCDDEPKPCKKSKPISCISRCLGPCEDSPLIRKIRKKKRCREIMHAQEDIVPLQITSCGR